MSDHYLAIWHPVFAYYAHSDYPPLISEIRERIRFNGSYTLRWRREFFSGDILVLGDSPFPDIDQVWAVL